MKFKLDFHAVFPCSHPDLGIQIVTAELILRRAFHFTRLFFRHRLVKLLSPNRLIYGATEANRASLRNSEPEKERMCSFQGCVLLCCPVAERSVPPPRTVKQPTIPKPIDTLASKRHRGQCSFGYLRCAPRERYEKEVEHKPSNDASERKNNR